MRWSTRNQQQRRWAAATIAVESLSLASTDSWAGKHERSATPWQMGTRRRSPALFIYSSNEVGEAGSDRRSSIFKTRFLSVRAGDALQRFRVRCEPSGI